MPADWSSFVGALAARGCAFADVAMASDRRAVIVAAGVTDALDIAIIETHWAKHAGSTAGAQAGAGASAAVGGGFASTTGAAPAASSLRAPHAPPTAWHRLDAARLRAEPEEVQDAVLSEELTFALRGISGALIRFDTAASGQRTVVVAPSLPTSTAKMLHAALRNALALFALEPVCRHEFSGRSLIRGAVGEAVREVCAAYVRSVADLQMRAGEAAFSLSRVCTEADACGYAVRRLAALFATISSPSYTQEGHAPDGGGLTGPWLLNALHAQYVDCSGNPDDERVVGLVLRRAARPYLRTLFDWVHRGDLSGDPFQEFFVIDTGAATVGGDATAGGGGNVAASAELDLGAAAGTSGASSGGGGDAAERIVVASRDAIDRWENRFKLVTRQVPSFLTHNKAYKLVHTSGKYCHMLREFREQQSQLSLRGPTATATSAMPSSAAATTTTTIATAAAGPGGASTAASDRAAAIAAAAAVNPDSASVIGAAVTAAAASAAAASSGDAALPVATATTPFLTATDEDAFEWGDTARLERAVHRAHTAASTNVLQMLVARHRLVDRLSALRLYFFIAQGDWLVNFLDAAHKLLQRPAAEVKTYSLNVLLQASIAKSSARDDPSHSFTRCSLSDVTLAQAVDITRQRDPAFHNVYRGLSVAAAAAAAPGGGGTAALRRPREASPPCFELLQLDIASEWPLSLILNDVFLTKLNFAFRLLLRCKICERALNSVVWFQHHQVALAGRAAATAATTTSAAAPERGRGSVYSLAVSLRSQLLQFVRQLQFYAAHDVLEPAWRDFGDKVRRAPGINHIGAASSELCSAVLRGLALTSEHGFRSVWGILDVALAFAQLMGTTGAAAVAPAAPPGPAAAPSPAADAVRRKLLEWQARLYQLLTELADPSQPDSTSLLQMLTWLDFNAFYERHGVYKVRFTAAQRANERGGGAPFANAGALDTAASSAAASPERDRDDDNDDDDDADRAAAAADDV